jgi:hypothetical protein
MRRTVVACDRCSRVVPEEDRDAGRVYAATVAGRDVVGTATEAADLCSSCIDGLAAFMADAA